MKKTEPKFTEQSRHIREVNVEIGGSSACATLVDGVLYSINSYKGKDDSTLSVRAAIDLLFDKII